MGDFSQEPEHDNEHDFLAQPHLHPSILLAAILRIVGSDWQVLSESIGKRRFYASHLQLVGDCSGPILRKCDILSGPASAVGETEQQESPVLVGWIRK